MACSQLNSATCSHGSGGIGVKLANKSSLSLENSECKDLVQIAYGILSHLPTYLDSYFINPQEMKGKVEHGSI